jgi:arginine:ornithine antiporter/lysine permease
MLAVIIIAIGIPVYIWARKQHAPSEKAFSKREALFACTLIIISIAAIYALSRGLVTV